LQIGNGVPEKKGLGRGGEKEFPDRTDLDPEEKVVNGKKRSSQN